LFNHTVQALGGNQLTNVLVNAQQRTHAHTHMHTHIHTYTHTYTHIHTHTHIHARTHTRTKYKKVGYFHAQTDTSKKIVIGSEGCGHHKILSIETSTNTNWTPCLSGIMYVHSKFVPQEAVGIYYIPWPAKKIAAQNSSTSLSARNCKKLCSLHSQLAKAAKKNELQKNILYLVFLFVIELVSLVKPRFTEYYEIHVPIFTR